MQKKDKCGHQYDAWLLGCPICKDKAQKQLIEYEE